MAQVFRNVHDGDGTDAFVAKAKNRHRDQAPEVREKVMRLARRNLMSQRRGWQACMPPDEGASAFHFFAAVLLNAVALPVAAFDASPAIKAPVHCTGGVSCGSAITLSEAMHSYEEAKEFLAHYKAEMTSQTSVERITRKEKRPDFPIQDDELEAIFEKDGDHFIPGFPYTPAPMIDRHVCRDDSALSHRYFWTSAQDLDGGESALLTLKERLNSGASKDGFVFVQAAESSATERHYAICRVTTIGVVSGPPRECTTIAIALPDQVLIRAGNSRRLPCPEGARYRPSGAIEIEFDVTTTRPLSQFARAIAYALDAKFKLSVETLEATDAAGKNTRTLVRSTAGLRDSLILRSGWREAIDVDVHIGLEDGILEVRSTVHALVSRQAVGNLANYRGLDDAQRSQYAAAFDLGIGAAIQSVCTRYQRHDAIRVTCN